MQRQDSRWQQAGAEQHDDLQRRDELHQERLPNRLNSGLAIELMSDEISHDQACADGIISIRDQVPATG